ncbi:hypothetical protein B0H16DRAFT_1738233 [Mycena metata]|uniref:Uncharacterized protein n=1 Tax=Mycena metata TaxID=1033252 RepID=A0AAD7HJ65_9AGAR|nr:hypothetical protein B0H16DRAFT_1738233 [Mycena metata]
MYQQPSTLINSFITFIALAVAPLLLVTTSPFHLPRSLQNIPHGAHALAFDPESGVVSAYGSDGAFLGHANHTTVAKRTDGTCSNLSPDDLRALAGWGLVEAQAATNWGNGGYTLATDIANEGDYPAIACVSSTTAMVTVNGNPSCATSNQTSSGKLVGTSGTVSLSALEGTSSSTTITTTKTSDWSLGLTVAATIGIPDIIDTTSTVSTSVSITNSLSNASVLFRRAECYAYHSQLDFSVSTTSNNQQTQTIAMQAADGQTCSLVFTSTSCTDSGTGSIVMTATGWAWFEYSSKVQGHYYWALNIEAYIPDVSQRSSSIDFTAAISATNDSKYQGTCN